MPVRLGVILAVGLAVGAALWILVPWGSLLAWAVAEQRSFQNTMARALRGVQAGDPLAVWTLCAATAAYGFVHALGPGHGKVLIGGAALASGVRLRRLCGLTVLSSLAQAGTAIALVGGLVFAFRVAAKDLVALTETWLAPASYAAIAAIGAILVIRGIRSWWRTYRPAQGGHSDHGHGACTHAHGPVPEDLDTMATWRDGVALVASIAVRPCTGALFVLVIAARFDAFWIGALSVVTMGAGTAAFNLAVAGSGVAARGLARAGAGAGPAVQSLSAALHVLGGGAIVALSLAKLLPSLA